MLSRYFEDLGVTTIGWRHFFLLADFALGAFFAFSIFLFCLDVVKNKLVKNVFFRSLFFAIPAIYYFAIFFTSYIVAGSEIDHNNIINPIYGPLGILYDIAVIAAPFAGMGFIIWGLRKSKDEEKGPYVYSLVGIFLSVFLILCTHIFFAEYITQSENYRIYNLLGIFSPICIVLFPGYAILRFRLFNTKIIAAETLSFLIILGTFLQIFLSENTYQIVIRTLIFFATFFLLGWLAKSVDREVKRKEELMVLTEKLAVANKELKRLDNAKSEFISIASHQLRTPLTAIKGYISLILEGSYGEVSATVQDVLNKVYVVNNRMSQLVEDLLNVSRIESGRVQYNFQPTQLEPLVAEIVDMLTLFAKSKNLYLKIKLPKKSLPKLNLDPNKIKEVVSNLIDNALKYTKEGGVSVTVEEKDGFACVNVQDTGIGIRPEDVEHVFQKFTRSSETIKLDVSGTGLGLYVGKNFVEAHKGKLTVESEGAGKGTRFTIMLPLPAKA